MTQVELHVKIGVLHPVRSIQAPRHLYNSSAKQRHFAKAPLEACDHVFEPNEAAGGSGRVVDSQAAYMLRRVCLLKIYKCSVKYSQLFHVFLPLAFSEIMMNGSLVRPPCCVALVRLLQESFVRGMLAL
jgi:hypothetical protein